MNPDPLPPDCETVLRRRSEDLGRRAARRAPRIDSLGRPDLDADDELADFDTPDEPEHLASYRFTANSAFVRHPVEHEQ